MVTPDSEFSQAEPTSAVDDTTPSLPASAILQLPAERIGRLLVFAIVAGLVAGAASVLIGERIMNFYNRDLFPPIENNPSAENMRRMKDARLYTAALTFTTLGGLLGLALGLAGGLGRRSTYAGVNAAILGLLLGSAAAASMSLVVVSIFYKSYEPQSGDLVLPLLTHGAIWSALGGVGGLAFGLGLGGRGRWKSTLVGGLAGAAAATVIYELVGALAFASNKTDLPLSSSSTTRAMALLLVASLSSIGAVLASHQPAKREARSSVPS
jgi:hypothetical protein